MGDKLLHGTLLVTIFGVTGLSENIFDKITKLLGSKLFVTVDIGDTTVGKTRFVDYSKNPRWDEKLHIYCAHMASNVTFNLKKYRTITDVFLGKFELSVTDINDQNEIHTRFDIFDENLNLIMEGLQFHVKVQYIDVTSDPNWDCGIKTPKFPGVPYTFFTQKTLSKVTLYQDAHVDDTFVPKIPLSNGKDYEQHRCWEDIFDAITNAKHLIYITGWSVYTEITLIRDPERPKPGGNMTLGELLKKKSEEGVRVLMLIWDDKLSAMATHDNQTYKYFENTKVDCVLCPRNQVDGNLLTEFYFTHHQKTVVVDSELPNGSSNLRRIVSFVGGIDLCDGRYDTQSHSLFRTLSTVHHNDFHQPNFNGASIKKGGPREPWHDIHCRLEGSPAWDVLINFEQRWNKQGINKDLLVNVQDSTKFIPRSNDIFPEDDHETWTVQVFRSIDSKAASGFPDSPEETAAAGLINGEDGVIDRSIQDGYIHAIRRAKRFIYIENQYFIGSSFDWKTKSQKVYGDITAYNLIPKELSLKIVSKIEKGERFTVYIVIPMWPEGKPHSQSIQDILHWQRETMEMMYTDVVKALRAQKSNAKPEDYLLFLCLGNREVKIAGEYEPPETPEHNSDYFRAQTNRRFMIYVHAKMMIVDDEYIIIGSANINERSMNGGRDTEIAMGAYQPYHIWQDNNPAMGQIHGFRISLWYEHFGLPELHNVFLKPETEECVKKVNEIGKKNWDSYTSDTFGHDLPGYLMKYPIRVDEEGKIVELPGWKFFPDTQALVCGSSSSGIPSIITTF